MDGFKKFITHYKQNEVIYKKGEDQADFYIINKGKVQLKVYNDELSVVTLSKGDFFGEESLNETQSAAYTVEAVDDADIIKIPYSSLAEMMKKNTAISFKILKKLSEKHIRILDNVLNLKKPPASQPASVQTVATPKAPPPTPSAPSTPEVEKTSEMLEPTIKAYLVIERSNRVVQLTKAHTFLGRKDYTTGFVPDVDLTKEDEEKYISRKHSKISYIDGKFYLSEEPGAVNGTFLNGTKLSTGVKHELSNKDELTLCHLNIIFKY
ncbi:MAG: cyclic nucleotide-binding domain-containing protein [bacterium]|nr:cyclic nucleotide-binding domain-containing protein [bacterium]